jgi:hypothetical protein
VIKLYNIRTTVGIPRECDPQFAMDASPKDQDPFSHKFQYASVKPLAPADAGTVLGKFYNYIK